MSASSSPNLRNINLILCLQNLIQIRDESKAAATSKMVHLVIIVNGWKPLTIITMRSILKVAAPLDPPLQV